jgi:hypothetical protein
MLISADNISFTDITIADNSATINPSKVWLGPKHCTTETAFVLLASQQDSVMCLHQFAA